MTAIMTPAEIFQAAQAASAASSTSGRASLFRRALGASGIASLRQAGFNPDDDDEAASIATLARAGRLPMSGMSSERWTKDAAAWAGEEYGLGARQSTAAASTGAVVTVTGSVEFDLKGAVLLLHDPTGYIVGNGGYWSAITINKREFILGASSSEWKPCDSDDLSVLVGDGAGSPGGIYLGDLEKDDNFSIGVYLPTLGAGTLDWGLVVRGQPVESKKGYSILQGGTFARSRYVR